MAKTKSKTNKATPVKNITYDNVKGLLTECGLKEGKDFYPFALLDSPRVLIELDAARKLCEPIIGTVKK